LDFEIAIQKLKSYKSTCVDQILVELIQAGAEILSSVKHILINFIWNTEGLLQK
jgi:hypothetical protein